MTASGLLACQVSPDKGELSPPTVARESLSQHALLQLLQSDSAQDRLTALRALAKQPLDAQKLLSAILPLLADARLVHDTRYLGAGYRAGQSTSPAEQAAELLSRMGSVAILPLRLRLYDPNPVIRRYTIKALGAMALPEHMSWFIAGLRDKQPEVVKEAYTALLQQDKGLLVKAIAELELDSFALSQQLLLIQLVGDSQQAEAISLLQTICRNEEPTLRRAAFNALVKFPQARIGTTVLQGLEDSDRSVRESAILLAPYHNSPQVLAALIGQFDLQDPVLDKAVQEVLPLMTGEDKRDVEEWRRWWRGRHQPLPE